MTRSQAYAMGFSEGCRWAESDIRSHSRLDPAIGSSTSDTLRAHDLGRARGYRDTWARYEAGTLTWEMFDLAPRAPR